MARKLTAVDVCEVTGYSRHQLQALLCDLSPYAERGTLPRVAREFRAHDLHVFCVVHALEERLGMKRSHVILIGQQVHKALSGPRKVNPKARLLISLYPPLVTYLEAASVEGEGLLVSLGPVFETVDCYLSCDDLESQTSLHLGPDLVVNRRKRGQR